jgi:hypothetical protein
MNYEPNPSIFTVFHQIRKHYISIFLIFLIFIVDSKIIIGNKMLNSTLNNHNRFNNAEVRSDRTTLIKEKPFFPFGFYHVSWENSANNQMRIGDWQEIAEAGFNAIYLSSPWENVYEEVLDEAVKLGLQVIAENIISRSQIIDTFKNKSAVFGWSIADDVDDGRYSTQQVCDFYRQAKTANPDRLTYISGYTDDLGRFAQCSDLIARQAYPIRTGIDSEISTVYSDISRTLQDMVRWKHDRHHRSIYANIQAFSWAEMEPDRPYNQEARAPTAQEVRNMTYQALLAGAKGIFYYTYHDEIWHLPDRPELWQGVKALVPEIQEIAPFLLDGDAWQIASDRENLLVGIWTLKERALLMLINNSYTKIDNILVKLPASYSDMTSLFASNSMGINLDRGWLSGSLLPLEVSVYQLKIQS